MKIDSTVKVQGDDATGEYRDTHWRRGISPCPTLHYCTLQTFFRPPPPLSSVERLRLLVSRPVRPCASLVNRPNMPNSSCCALPSFAPLPLLTRNHSCRAPLAHAVSRHSALLRLAPRHRPSLARVAVLFPPIAQVYSGAECREGIRRAVPRGAGGG